MINIYIINLKNRVDRKNNFINNNNKYQFNFNFFDAIVHNEGWKGCALSHISLVSYAKNNQLPYIIVSEDDTIFNMKYEYFIKIIKILETNLDKWEVFNGNPTYAHLLNKNIKFKYSNFSDDFICIPFGLTTNFIIYNSFSYDKIINYDYSDKFDVYLSLQCKQITTYNYITTQDYSYSDILGYSINYNDIINESNQFMKSILNNL